MPHETEGMIDSAMRFLLPRQWVRPRNICPFIRLRVIALRSYRKRRILWPANLHEHMPVFLISPKDDLSNIVIPCLLPDIINWRSRDNNSTEADKFDELQMPIRRLTQHVNDIFVRVGTEPDLAYRIAGSRPDFYGSGLIGNDRKVGISGIVEWLRHYAPNHIEQVIRDG